MYKHPEVSGPRGGTKPGSNGSAPTPRQPRCVFGHERWLKEGEKGIWALVLAPGELQYDAVGSTSPSVHVGQGRLPLLGSVVAHRQRKKRSKVSKKSICVRTSG